MPLRKRITGWLAIYAIALNAILWGLAPMAAAAPNDPFQVICHSEATAPGDQTPSGPASVPAQACDHCTLCAAAAAPSAALDSTLATTLTPVKLLQVLLPAPALPRDGIASSPHLARGPPAFV